MLIRKYNNRNIFEDFFNDPFFSGLNNIWMKPNDNVIPYDIIEEDNKYVVELMLPGFDKENIDLKIDDGELIITGERKEVDNTKYNQKYSYFGKIKKSFTLPKDIIIDNIDAEYINGVLRVSVPKDTKLITSKSIVIK